MDELDRRLLEVLRAEARTSMAELGRQVGLSRTAVLARVRRLEADGVIRGYHADVAEQPRREHVARVGVVVRAPNPSVYLGRLTSIPEVTEVESVAGEYDLLVRVAADSAARLDGLLDRINGWRETVKTTTFVVLRRYG